MIGGNSRRGRMVVGPVSAEFHSFNSQMGYHLCDSCHPFLFPLLHAHPLDFLTGREWVSRRTRSLDYRRLPSSQQSKKAFPDSCGEVICEGLRSVLKHFCWEWKSRAFTT